MPSGSFRNTLMATLLLAGTAALAYAAERNPAAQPGPAAVPAPAEVLRFFETSIRPVLVTRCQSCHGRDKQSGGLRVDSLAALRKGGVSGPSVVPGKPEQSPLAQALSYHGVIKMPPGGKLPGRQVTDIGRWIRMGAPWPETEAKAGTGPVKAKLWSFEPVRKPAVPAVRQSAWVKTPVDAFILAELEKKGLRPSPPADKRTLIRRATFDLTGLPPTPGEVDAFLADRSPAAFAKVVDRLLASPRYGERWGRHWLDVARYADSNGLDENVAHGNAWRYRDWVIRSFNEDKPYDRFITEQLAGDLLPTLPDEDLTTRHGRLIATGFLSLGPKVLAEADKEKMVMDIVDEQIDTTGRAFMGMTLGCARCHDHKFDPISTEDYYALAGIFKSTKTMESLVTIAKWWENSLATPEDLARKAAHDRKVAEANGAIAAVIDRASKDLAATGAAPPKDPKALENAFRPDVRAELKSMREQLAVLEKAAPEMPAAMGVAEAAPVEVPVHIRGDHLSLGKTVPRRFPVTLAGSEQPALAPKHSGRLELARWITSPSHPLTGRVAVNRIWRWHFGRGLVGSTDNFGVLGEKPSHPELLDWLASVFTSSSKPQPLGGSAPGLNWSFKALHRLLMLSSVYQQGSSAGPQPAAGRLDPENRLLWRANLRRLEAEEIRDSLLAVSGTLDPEMGGSLLHVKNREFFFDHTSIDKTKYDSKKRSIYLPVVRNNVYDVFQLFDFVDPAVLESNRASTTVAPQALFWLNSPLVTDAAQALAARLGDDSTLDDRGRIRRLHLTLYGRLPSALEITNGARALSQLETRSGEPDLAKRRSQAWSWYSHALLTTNEFVYLR